MLLNEVFRNYFFLSQNECSFVSLRDVERAMKVITWFHSIPELINWVIGDEDNDRDQDNESSEESGDDENNDDVEQVEQVEQVRFLRFFLLLHKILLIKHIKLRCLRKTIQNPFRFDTRQS